MLSPSDKKGHDPETDQVDENKKHEKHLKMPSSLVATRRPRLLARAPSDRLGRFFATNRPVVVIVADSVVIGADDDSTRCMGETSRQRADALRKLLYFSSV